MYQQSLALILQPLQIKCVQQSSGDIDWPARNFKSDASDKVLRSKLSHRSNMRCVLFPLGKTPYSCLSQILAQLLAKLVDYILWLGWILLNNLMWGLARHLDISGYFSQCAGDEIAAELMTALTGPIVSKASCSPSPVTRSAYTKQL